MLENLVCASTCPASSSRLGVLVADDDPGACRLLGKMLNRWGYEVTIVNNGEEALRVLQAKDGPSLAILDWDMAGLTGLEVCQKIRARDHGRRYSYLILLTAHVGEQYLVQGLSAGADEYLCKPINSEELRVRVETGVRITYEKALAESERRFFSAVDGTSVGTALADMDGRWLQVNRAFADFLGCSQAEVLGQDFATMIHPLDQQRSWKAFQALSSGQCDNYQIEQRYQNRRGQTVWALLTVSRILDSPGKPDYAVIQLQDISQRKIAEEALRESEARFRAITDHAAEMIAVLETDGHIHYASPAYQRILGYSGEELQGANLFTALVHPEDRLSLQCRVTGAEQEGLPEAAQARMRHKDGSWRVVQHHTGLIRGPSGSVERLVLTSRVVEDWLNAQTVLEEREEQLKLLLDSTGEAIYGLDRDGCCTFCNTAMLRLLGYDSADELLGQRLHALLHHHHADGSSYGIETCPIYQALRSGGTAHLGNEVFWRADGSSFPVEYWVRPVRKNGELVGSVVTFIDVSEKKAAEEELSSAHAESELVINSVPSILIVLDPEARITEWNLAADHTFGLSKAEVLGKSLEHCGIHWLNPRAAEEIAEWMKQTAPKRYDQIRFDRQGQTRFLGITASGATILHKQRRVLITGADTTERKALEEQLKQAQKLEAIGQLAAGVAHEINTPTQFVGDNLRFVKDAWNPIRDLLCQAGTLRQQAEHGAVHAEALACYDRHLLHADLDFVGEEIPRALDQALDGIQRVAGIVRAMKEFSHPGSEAKTLMDINAAIATTVIVTRNEWKYVAELETHLDPDLAAVRGHLGEFNQVILNLIVNAAHAVGDTATGSNLRRGRIKITTRRDPPWAEIQVSDSGTGIPEGILPRIFEPFFTTKPLGKGTGQGLALAHACIVGKHGGQIWCKSEVGRGTTFFIRLPLQ